MSDSGGLTVKANNTGTLLPRHVAIIMDGNGRWANERHLPRAEGHRAGAKSVRTVVEESRRLGIRYLTLYAFSTENWKRPADEVSALMKLFELHLAKELERLTGNGVRLRAIGDLTRLPAGVRSALDRTIELTVEMDGMDLILAVSYGGREEIAAACRRIAADVAGGHLVCDRVNEETLSSYLYAPDVPDPDLLIRTSGECRISNFLLWQVAYAEIVVSPVLWPDFSKDEFSRCLSEYSRRNRRFGLTGEQIKHSVLPG
jgi:undecaprenyl diphosphate synthase